MGKKGGNNQLPLDIPVLLAFGSLCRDEFLLFTTVAGSVLLIHLLAHDRRRDMVVCQGVVLLTTAPMTKKVSPMQTRAGCMSTDAVREGDGKEADRVLIWCRIVHLNVHFYPVAVVPLERNKHSVQGHYKCYIYNKYSVGQDDDHVHIGVCVVKWVYGPNHQIEHETELDVSGLGKNECGVAAVFGLFRFVLKLNWAASLDLLF